MTGRFKAVLFDLGDTLWEGFSGKGRAQVTSEAVARASSAILGSAAPPARREEFASRILARMDAKRSAREAAALVSFADPIFEEDDLWEALSEVAASFGGTVSEPTAIAFGHDLTRYDRLFPESLAVLERLRSTRPDLVIGIVSNTVVQPQVIDYYLKECGLSDMIDFLVLSSELRWRKPHPAIYAAALASAGVKAEEALFVGDRVLEDVMGPGRLGIKAVLRVNGDVTPPLPEGCSTLAVVRNLNEIVPLL